ncbi:hypothetical protein Tco_0839671 [Tanacetum coccineum]|uniref:Uncharacterized protein n=1 Tax=Tanacetum coccineum TaxID=301880 RepID=A0ABQ5AT48_9ASTR
MKRVNTFVAIGSKEQERKEKKAKGSEETAKGSRKKMLGRKKAGKQQQQESSKKQKMEEDKESDEVEEVSEDDEGELLKHLVIKKDEDISINVIPLATKLPVIVDYKLHKEGMLVHYQLIRADGSSKRYSSMIRMLQGIDREDLEVNERFECIPPEYDEEFVILERLQGHLRFLLHSTVSMKLLLPVEVKTALISAAGYKDTTVADLQLLEDLLLSRG